MITGCILILQIGLTDLGLYGKEKSRTLRLKKGKN